ncbi:LETM1 domain-containing protein 1 [Coccinella septempunctata]|uniref:LETM1 domain-containing protein 1 n=1 Tax=Coccinella septempunctata TaxID=41139 RepID=UPI001D090961|nr:LETM1 domain-containing protein 1 [Coccinella septempunctata]
MTMFLLRTLSFTNSSRSQFLLRRNGYPLAKYLHDKTHEKKIKFYVVDRYILYLKDYEKHIEKRFPNAVGLYRSFKEGTKNFIRDVKLYYSIVRAINKKQKILRDFTRKEIELYDQLPRDMLKLTPILIFSALPFTNYVIFPLIYFFPKQLLSQHFWTIQQRVDFSRSFLHERLLHNKPIFRHLQEQLSRLKGHELYEPWRDVLGKLGSGVQPEVDQILQCQELFVNEPYNLSYLRGIHIKHLLHLHNMNTFFWFRRSRLSDKALILKEMDLAILREGGVHNLTIEALRMSCYIRGLNPTNMKNEDMINWLNKWIKVSKTIDYDSASLLLHCPILLGYNESSNWTLIYSNIRKQIL